MRRPRSSPKSSVAVHRHGAPTSAAARLSFVVSLSFAFCALNGNAARCEDRPPVFSWVGMYMGASLGGAVPLHAGERLQATSGFGAPAFDLYPSGVTRPGVTVGVQAGYNWQRGPFVWGFETDLSLLDGRRGPQGFSPPRPPMFPAFRRIHARVQFEREFLREHSRARRLRMGPLALLSDGRRRRGRRERSGDLDARRGRTRWRFSTRPGRNPRG